MTMSIGFSTDLPAVPPARLPADGFYSVREAFDAACLRYGDRPFLHIPAQATAGYGGQAVDWTYGSAGARIRELEADFRGAGLARGHRVALMLDNRAEFFLYWLALNGLGVSVVPLNAESSAAELAHVLRDSAAVMVVALDGRWQPLEPALGQALGAMGAALPPVCRLGTGSAAVPMPQGQPMAAEDECALVYTSGSTGLPKGCMLSNEYMLAFGRWYNALGGLCRIEPGAERLITPLPLVHMNALACSSMAMILSGGCIVQLDRFHPGTWWETVAQSGATIVHYLGVMPAILLQLPQQASDRAHAVRFGFGAGVHPRHHAAFEERFGFALVESWSMTEVGAGGAVAAQLDPRHPGTRCFGRPTPQMEYRIVDEEGEEVPPGAAGELRVRAAGNDPRAGFFSGYANQPALTEAAWAGGYFHTGDIVRQAEDGSLHFVDRKKSIIRRSGENIASLEVEAVLNQLPMVRQVGVGPVEDETRGEEVMACVELMPGHAPTRDLALGIFAAAAQRLAYFKLPGYIAFVPALPLTASQKLQRGVLKQAMHALLDEHAAFDLRALKKRPDRHDSSAKPCGSA
ncbi:ATP-dependent acyl-CoA ligase [Cupriavidus sp. TA19]|uniref:AMP-binding protein n=1 Tax=unclassified Cupriavidus TaxID=2640874 RepID=UPI0027294984|nr:AMP-binding protein [Cupriavidus sp. TA19]GLC91004.1 ATP-dependent acyl-CoA ligase [Cupriavidus sp. TA19]